MFKKIIDEKLDFTKLNEVLRLSSNILKIAYMVTLIVGLYAITLIFEKWGIISFFVVLLKVISPFFIGLLIAWLLNPAVCYLKKKKVNRILGTTIVYIILLSFFYVLISAIMPVLSSQINDFVSTLPKVINSLKSWIDGIFNNIQNTSSVNVENIKIDLFNSIEQTGRNLTNNLPGLTVNFVKSFISGVGILFIGLLIGFFMLFDFDSVSKKIISFLPTKYQKDANHLLDSVDLSLRNFVQGTLILSFIVFLVATIGFSIIGLKAPILFGLLLGLTNIIPFIGAYIGGIPAVIVGFVQSPTVGVLTIIINILIQFIEGNFLQPIVMSRKMQLHPVSIMLGLLICEHFFGILGLIIATPLIAIIKVVATFINKKYDIFDFKRKS